MQTFLKTGGGYRNLKVYLLSEIIYDITFYFTSHYLPKGDRTVDQMIQASRSGKQNIAEGSAASTTSKETEIKLTNVAKASLEELLIDYQDYLRVRNKPVWTASHPRFNNMRRYLRSKDFERDYCTILPRLTDEEIANLCITLINQSTYMLRKLIERQQEEFLRNGGIREQMTRARLQTRNNTTN